MRTAKEVRVEAGLSLEKAAAFAGVSGPTVRLYEASPDAVSPAKRKVLDAYYAGLTKEKVGA